ncbi:MAG TPA: cytochrome P460 family protein [Geobacteraceae bacterium]|nr:cytochrome P460 family protein [Geobacteraceae bacterium]
MKKLTAMTAVILVLSCAAIAAGAGKAALPQDYEKWEKSSRKVISDKQSLFYGIHYIYADKKALKAYKSGGPYPEGSRFAVVNYNIRDVGGKPVEGKKNMIVLMKKDKGAKETGGWIFAGFTPEGKPSGIDPVKNCYECHLKEAKDRYLVISRYSDFK